MASHVLGEPEPDDSKGEAAQSGRPYTHLGYNRFLDPEGYPAVKPPWGTLNAIDLDAGEIRWSVTLGEVPELTRRGLPPTGTENYGGPIVTAGGLVFVGATKDERFRAFDKRTGRLLWETALPAGGYATPATYEKGGRQYVVIAAGGGKMGTTIGRRVRGLRLARVTSLAAASCPPSGQWAGRRVGARPLDAMPGYAFRRGGERPRATPSGESEKPLTALAFPSHHSRLQASSYGRHCAAVRGLVLRRGIPLPPRPARDSGAS